MKISRFGIGIIFIFPFLFGPMLFAGTTPKISPETENAFSKLQANPQLTQGLEFLENDDANTLAEQKAIVAIPAPPFKEKIRADYYLKRLQALGLKDVKMDNEGNVYGIRPGTGATTLAIHGALRSCIMTGSGCWFFRP